MLQFGVGLLIRVAALAVLFGELAAAGEFTHIDGWVVVFEDFLANDVLNHVFNGNDTRHGAVLINCDGELLVAFEEGL